MAAARDAAVAKAEKLDAMLLQQQQREEGDDVGTAAAVASADSSTTAKVVPFSAYVRVSCICLIRFQVLQLRARGVDVHTYIY